MPDSQMPDPQAQIDAVFTPTPTPVAAPTPSPAVEEPVVEVPVVAPVVEAPKVEATVVEPNVVKVNDDTPLAFVGASIEPSISKVPPATIPPVDEKPKSKKRIGLLLLMLFFLAGSGGGGYWYYQKYAAPGSINITSDDYEAKKIITGMGTNSEKLKTLKDEGLVNQNTSSLDQAKNEVSERVRDTNERVYSNKDEREEVAAGGTGGGGDGGTGGGGGDENPCADKKKGEFVCDRSPTNARTLGKIAIKNAIACDGNGGGKAVDLGDVCAPELDMNQSCQGLTRQSMGETHNGVFVGCVLREDGVWLNAFCGDKGDTTTALGAKVKGGGTVRYVEDYANDSCGRTFGVTTTTQASVRDDDTTTTTTTESETPVMACTSITRTPTTVPTIGSTPVFTCLGTVTPADAGTLSYKFRYKKDSGAYVALANKTPTTAELTIAACGTYSVECQVCATLEGVLTCDPIWTGATQ